MTLSTNIPNICFPYELDTLEFSGWGNEKGRITISIGGFVALDADLVCDKGKLCLYDLADLYRDYLRDQPQTVTISVAGVGNSTTMLPCDVQMSVPAAVFNARSFLTLCTGHKETTEDAEELLSFYGPSGNYMVNVKLEYVDDTLATVVSVDKTIQVSVTNAGLTTFAIPMAEYKKEGYRLIAMTLNMGKKRMIYNVLRSCGEFTYLRFRNTFGCMETAYFNNVETEHQSIFQTAKINGQMTNFAPEDKMEFEGIRSYVPDAEKDMFCDLARSTMVVQCEDEQSVFIKSSSVKTDRALDGACVAKIKWMPTGRRVHFEPHFRLPVFDSTFDQSFE